jgi:UDP-GlcNAc:undecaprenyl-phosphate/decaprenyl-phosphate GlcNAc-1-phosphate transferase
MSSLTIAFAVAASVSLLATPLVRHFAWRVGALDYADGSRKLHAGPVPYLGGIGLFASLLAGTLCGCQGKGLDPLALPPPLLLSAGLICTVGWLDDRYCLRVRWKLLGQLLATLPLVFTGHVLERIEVGGLAIDLGWWGIPVTIGWLVAGANALNFIDGADGLAATVGLIAAAATALVAHSLGHADAAVMALVLAGGLGGFLVYNWQPATIYLGDAGSMTVGLCLAALAVDGSGTPALGSRLVVLMALLGIPMADLALAVVRRLLSGQAFWIADRAHIHHRLLDRGLSAAQVAGVFAGLTVATGSIAFAAAAHAHELLSWAFLLTLSMAVVRLDLAASHECELARQFAARWLPLAAWLQLDSNPNRGRRSCQSRVTLRPPQPAEDAS